MCGSGAVSLVRSTVPLCSRTWGARGWVPHVVPVARDPFCARGSLFLFLSTAHVQQNCTVVQYKKKGRTPTNERTTNEIPFNIEDICTVLALFCTSVLQTCTYVHTCTCSSTSVLAADIVDKLASIKRKKKEKSGGLGNLEKKVCCNLPQFASSWIE